MEKRVWLTLTVLVVAVGLSSSVDLVVANPYLYERVTYPVNPPPEVQAATIKVSSPSENVSYSTENLTLHFTVNFTIPVLPELFFYTAEPSEVYYKASWLPNSTYLDLSAAKKSILPQNRIFLGDHPTKWQTGYALTGYQVNPAFVVNLTCIPAGNQSIEMFAIIRGSNKDLQASEGITIRYGSYALAGSQTVHFNIEAPATVAPTTPVSNETTDKTGFQTILVTIAMIVAIGIVGVTFAYYRKSSKSSVT